MLFSMSRLFSRAVDAVYAPAVWDRNMVVSTMAGSAIGMGVGVASTTRNDSAATVWGAATIGGFLGAFGGAATFVTLPLSLPAGVVTAGTLAYRRWVPEK
jgi:hypothetical protein